MINDPILKTNIKKVIGAQNQRDAKYAHRNGATTWDNLADRLEESKLLDKDFIDDLETMTEVELESIEAVYTIGRDLDPLDSPQKTLDSARRGLREAYGKPSKSETIERLKNYQPLNEYLKSGEDILKL